MAAVIWGTVDWQGFTTGSGQAIGTPGVIWAYCERLNAQAQAGVKEVFDGGGVVRYRRNWGLKYRADGTFVPVSVQAASLLFDALYLDDPVLLTDTDLGFLWLFLDSRTREKVAGEAGPNANRLHITGWAYPALVQEGIGPFTP